MQSTKKNNQNVPSQFPMEDTWQGDLFKKQKEMGKVEHNDHNDSTHKTESHEQGEPWYARGTKRPLKSH